MAGTGWTHWHLSPIDITEKYDGCLQCRLLTSVNSCKFLDFIPLQSGTWLICRYRNVTVAPNVMPVLRKKSSKKVTVENGSGNLIGG